MSSFYDAQDIYKIDSILDYQAIKAQWWNEDLDIKRRKEAEFLIAEDVPSEAIGGYVVYNEAAQKQMIEFGIPIEKIVIRPNYYF